jgi:exosortase A
MTAPDPLPSVAPMGSSQATSAATSRPWLLLSMQFLLVLAGFALLWPTTHSLLLEWENTEKTTYTHGYLIVLISFWLLLRDRGQLGLHKVSPSIPACILLAGASLAWLVALRSGIQIGEHLLLPAMMWLALWGAMGKRVALLGAFALGYLYFAIPLWGSINDLLQSSTVVAVDLLLRVTGVPAYVEGNIVHLAVGTFQIAGGCSGLHYFIVALALAALYGEIHHDRLATRLQLLALATVLALATNWVRVYTIILAGYLTDMQHYLVRVEHYRFGWVVFAVMMAGFFYVARKLPATHREPARTLVDPQSLSSRGVVLRGVALSLMAFSIGPLWGAIVPVSAAQVPAAGTLLPVNPGAWSGPRVANELRWNPVFAGADVQGSGEYRSSGRMVQAFMATYAWQAQAKELIRYDNSIVEDGAEILSSSRIPPGEATELIVADSGGRQSVLWYSYWIDAMQTSSGVTAQLWYGVTSLAKRPVSSVAALRSPCEPDCESARSALREFTRASGWSAVTLRDNTRDDLP